MNTINLDAPNLTRLFNGPLLRDLLEDRYVAGIAAVYRLEPAAFGPELDPAGSIMAGIDVALPTIDWDAPQILQGITREQRKISAVSFQVTGDARALTWIPNAHQIGTPPVRFGLTGDRLSIVCDSIDPDAIDTAITRVRRHVASELAHAIEERNAWREHTARRIRDAVTKRRALIDALD